MSFYYDVFNTGFGWYAVVFSDKGLRYSSMKSSSEEAVRYLSSRTEPHICERRIMLDVRRVVRDFLDGNRYGLGQIKLDLRGAPAFYEACWRACRSIPLGETRTYSWIANQAGSAGASRAAGQAMARNWIPIIVPCHRVISSNGTLNGYGLGGPSVKRSLLEIELKLKDWD